MLPSAAAGAALGPSLCWSSGSGAGGDADRKKTRACTECHKSKNKCVYPPGSSVCERCARLGRECIPHLSRQGKRSKPGSSDGAAVAGRGDGAGRGASLAVADGQVVGSPVGSSVLGSHAHAMLMADSINLQRQLASSNSSAAYQGGTETEGNITQKVSQNDSVPAPANAASQGTLSNAQRMTSSESLNLLLNRAMNDNGGRGGTSIPPTEGVGVPVGSALPQQPSSESLNLLLSRAMNDNAGRGGTSIPPAGGVGVPVGSALPQQPSSESLNLLLSRAMNDNAGRGGTSIPPGEGIGIGVGSALPQQPPSESLNFLLSQAMNVNGGGGGTSIPGEGIGIGSALPQPQNFLAGMTAVDPVRLNAMLAQLASGSTGGGVGVNLTSNNCINKNIVGANNISNLPNAGNSNINPGLELSSLGADASALLMLAGTGGGGSSAQNNLGNMNKSGNNEGNTINKAIGLGVAGHGFPHGTTGGSGKSSGYVIPAPLGPCSAAGRSHSTVHTPSAQPMAFATERGGSVPLNIGGRNEENGNKSQIVAVAEISPEARISSEQGDGVMPKKQKRARISIRTNGSQDEGSGISACSDVDPALLHPQYPPISLIPLSGGSSGGKGRGGGYLTPEDAIGKYIARACVKCSGHSIRTSLRNHYGLQCQIREWISISLVRRSFSLLGKACALAGRCGIPMDRILSGVSNDNGDDGNSGAREGGRMSYLLATLLEPRARQSIPVRERHMLSPRLPDEILSTCGCQSCPTFSESEMRNRWIFIRETYRGVTRFYCSPAFERNVLCWTHISQIYEDNLADINSLIFVGDDFRKILLCGAHQLSMHHSKGMSPKPVRAFETRIRLLGQKWGQARYDDPMRKAITAEMIRHVQEGDAMTLGMGLRFVSFPTMDKTTYFLEFFHHSREGRVGRVGSKGASAAPLPWTRNLSDDSLSGTAIAALAAENESMKKVPSAGNGTKEAPAPAAFRNIVPGSLGKDSPPLFEDVIGSDDWIGINDILASDGADNHTDMMAALMN